MARKYDLISDLYQEKALEIVSSREAWEDFLRSACRNFRLRFDEQVLVYAQRPDATAVLEIERWNRGYGRWVNRGAKGIAVFEDADRQTQRLTHYFDISDTHETRYSIPVPIWTMKDEYSPDVIEALEGAFGTLEKKDTLPDAVQSAARNAVEDNLLDYLTDFEQIEGMTAKGAASFSSMMEDGVAYMTLTRLGMDAARIMPENRFAELRYYDTPEAANALGVATSEVASAVLSEVARTVLGLDRRNRTVVDLAEEEYNRGEEPERSVDNDRSDVHEDGRLRATEPPDAGAAGSDAGAVRADAQAVPPGSPEDSVHEPADELHADRASRGDAAESRGDGGIPDPADGGTRGRDGIPESDRPDGVGSEDEQPSGGSAGDRSDGGDLRLGWYDRRHEDTSLPFFGASGDINEILLTTPYLRASKAEICAFYETHPDTETRTEFIRGVFNNDYTELILGDGRRVGYKTWENVLQFWEGRYPSRRAQSFYDWGVIADHFEGLRLLGELRDTVKPLPSMEGQQSLLEAQAEEKSPAFVFSQEIIDAVLTHGSGVVDGKMRIYEQFEKGLPAKENASFLKQEYGIGGVYPIIAGTNIDEGHDGKGIHLSRGFDDDSPHMDLSWNQVERRIAELIKLDRYLSPKEKAAYPEWLQREEERRAQAAKELRRREILSATPSDARYEYHLGDKVYIGAQEYEILSFDDRRVMLYDLQFPLFQKEMPRDEFDAKVRENPMNDHLKAAPPAEEKTNTDDSPEQDAVDEFSDIDSAEIRARLAEAGIMDGKVVDPEALDNDPFIQTVSAVVEKAAEPETAEEQPADLTPPQPAWETQNRRRVQSFDLHPEIPMSERHTFDLAAHPVEEAGKKERFRRNLYAIQILQKCREQNRFATPEEQEALSKYVGWGGISEAFDETNKAWETEYLELSTVLTSEEYASARESTLTAFYTPPEVIAAVYKVLEQAGFREGNILEPSCGIGNFIGMLPPSMQESRVYGVEIDPISAGIAQQLYQRSSIAAQPFEQAVLPDSFFDAVVGNVPFGDFGVNDRRYDKYHFLIHDYFFAKSLDKLRPGGVMALITSRGTMDKESTAVRKYIAQRAELVGAIRLPNNTFRGNAGTEAVSDILILQKRDRIIDIEPDWVQLDTSPDGIRMNSYYVQHPEMILGEMKMVSGRFGVEPTCVPYPDVPLSDLLSEAVSNIHAEISAYEPDELDEEKDLSIPADPSVRNYSYTLVDGELYFRENSRMAPVNVPATTGNRIRALIEIRDCVRRLIAYQSENVSEAYIKQEQEKLNTLYDAFSAKYGLINSRANVTAFSGDSSFALLSALEILDENGQLERKADMFTRRTIRPAIVVTSVDTASEALALSLSERACVDMDFMEKLCGKTETEIFEELKGVIFLNPLYGYGNAEEQKYLTADEYLSGNVRAKLEAAKASARLYPEDYTVNVEALEKVQPTDLTASEISVQLGSTWIPAEDVEDFVHEFLDTPHYLRYRIRVHYSAYSGEWNIEGKSENKGNLKVYSTYGTQRTNAYKIIEETLNLRDIRIYNYVEDDEGKKKPVLNVRETQITQAKQELIKQGFKDWIWANPYRRERLCKLYNERFNSVRPREYDGSHLQFVGMNPEIELRPHQKNAVARILYGGNTLLAHVVGAGKTYTMAAAAMEMKRLGLCSKPLFVVPNHLTEQWASEFLQLYPAANILVATKRDFEQRNRKRICARIATGDYDAVIIGHSQFEKIPISTARQAAVLQDQLEEIIDGIRELRQNRGDKFSIKQMERSKKSIQLKLEKMNDQSRKDDVVTFEELGVDRLFVDESHYYKNRAKRCA